MGEMCSEVTHKQMNPAIALGGCHIKVKLETMNTAPAQDKCEPYAITAFN